MSNQVTKAEQMPYGINKNFLKRGTIQFKSITLTDEGDNMSGSVWMGELPRDKGYGVVLASSDAGFEVRIKTFKTEDGATEVYNNFKTKTSLSNAFKLMR